LPGGILVTPVTRHSEVTLYQKNRFFPLKDVRLETMWRVENLRFIGGFLLPHHQVKVFLHATSFSKMLVIIMPLNIFD